MAYEVGTNQCVAIKQMNLEQQPKKDLIKIELHHGSRKSVATLRTVRTLIVRRAPSDSKYWRGRTDRNRTT